MTTTKKLKKLTKKQHAAAGLLTAAAVEFIQLQNREIHPAGDFDSARRFYPAENFECCSGIRTPSRAYPFSLMVHARTADHVAAGGSVAAVDIKRLKRLWNKYENENAHQPTPTAEFRYEEIFKYAAAIVLDKTAAATKK